MKITTQAALRWLLNTAHTDDESDDAYDYLESWAILNYGGTDPATDAMDN